jgi:cell wall-associated NlpC family hydrolase
MALNAEQRRNLAIARRESRGASPRVRLSLIEAMKVESNYTNVHGGDRDSRGVLQQRRMYYPHSGENVKYDIDQYLSRAKRANRGFKGSAGQLAQAVQRSAYPGRYDEHAAEARSLLGGPMASSTGLQLAGRQEASGGLSGPSQNPMFAQLLQNSNDLAAGHMPGVNDFLSALVEQRQKAADSTQQTDLPMPGGGALPVVHGTVTPSTQKALNIVREAIGTPYVWGGSKPGGFDCSGLLQYAWAKAGVKIPRTTYDQFKTGQQVGRGQLKRGDAVFFRGSDSKGGLPGHVGMYIGGGKFIEAPRTGSKVHVSTLAGRTDYMGARRY